ncbi:MAG: ribosome small subunit-dependent GTPase A [Sandaracinaceae bacterium]|nr:ribosome small subunit-dependent GTPase A [Sandaracinaceae bacterium]
MIGRVLRAQSGQYWVDVGDRTVHCTLRGRLKKERRAVTDLAVIGDRVHVELVDEAGDEGVIDAVEERRNRFARRQPGGRGKYKEQVVVANLDWLFVVMACSKPPFNPRLLDRFLVIAELDAIPAAIVANKIDEGEDDRFASYEAIGYPVLRTSARDGTGIEALRAQIGDGVAAFVGPSGVGKSSLLNRLEPGLGAAVGAISETLDKGRHTTRVAELHPLAGGGWVADTPGLRELAAFALPAAELAGCFPEMRPFLGACRFPDCTHDREPDCAVRDAVAAGAISAARYDSYLRIRADEAR